MTHSQTVVNHTHSKVRPPHFLTHDYKTPFTSPLTPSIQTSPSSMYSELECGVCYRLYNPGLRCPRELSCHHTFCESCLRALSRTSTPEEWRCGAGGCVILCPLCREPTCVSSEGTIRAELRVDECLLVRLFDEGILDREEEEEEVNPGDEVTENQNQSQTATQTPAEESVTSPGTRGSRLRRSWKKVWWTIIGKSSQQSSVQNCLNQDDLRSLAMMSCYMF